MNIKNINFLKLIYRSLMVGMPQYTYNSFNQNPFLAAMEVQPYSTYINFKLNHEQVAYVDNYIKEYSDKLQLIPFKISNTKTPGYYINVNIYNCTSAILGNNNNNNNIIRCEINTCVKHQDGTIGTVILDYISNGLSLDPIALFKSPNKYTDKIEFIQDGDYNLIDCRSKKYKIDLQSLYSILDVKKFKISKQLVEYTDNIYYKNSIMDKVYYDSTLVNADLELTNYISPNFTFKYRDLTFNKIDSIFYFKNKINFVGSVWHNLYQ